jgi:hypothetical protein
LRPVLNNIGGSHQEGTAPPENYKCESRRTTVSASGGGGAGNKDRC